MKVLLLTFYFPPTNAIAALRPYSWANEFIKQDVSTTVVTVNFSGKEMAYQDYFNPIKTPAFSGTSNGYTVYRLPFFNRFYHSLQRTGIFKFRPFRVITYIGCTALGFLNITQSNNRIIRKFLNEHLKENKYDLIYCITQPVNMVSMISSISKKFKTPFALDFKDFVVQAESKITGRTFSERVDIMLNKFYLKRHIRKAKFITAVSQPILDELPTHSVKKIIFNGFERNLFENIPTTTLTEFTITILGTLFPGKHINVMTAGFKKFIEENPGEKIKINFLGTAAMEAVCNEIRKQIPGYAVNITHRMPRTEALSIVKSSHVLYYHGWLNYKGVYSGKVFEYLGAGKNILIAPNDHDVLEELIIETGAGKLAEDADSMAAVLNEWLLEWKQKGEIAYYGKKEKIEFYTRENQSQLLVSFLKSQVLA